MLLHPVTIQATTTEVYQKEATDQSLDFMRVLLTSRADTARDKVRVVYPKIACSHRIPEASTRTSREMITDSDFRLLLERYNRSWHGYRKVRKGPMKRISKHMRSLGCSSIEQYLDTLDENRAEQETLLYFLRITISRFFRDRRLWTSLADVVFPCLLEHSGALKIWCAGCSCGEEVYSLNILHQMQWGAVSSLEILATDANDACLERAQNGIYQKSSLRELKPDMLASCFQPSVQRNEFVITETFQKNITWRHHDFFGALPDSGFHVIFLRNNLLTYHSPAVQSTVLERILQSLMVGGFLVIGSHETLPPQPFNLVPTGCDMIYQLEEPV